ncbi:transglycosylase SLT domain-containing protein [Luteimonas sp. RD2P54]|uniref:Transglycosylase SLT domain-containing protein n=1 Tax=Luteimonas endophytica TaxID=3042023 RepID=A0ABT6JAB9_9GAMM|nr:lytic transglycosylase domain-containing protein [Luteimonas endophytica]MDH5823770.1 transglycosylase SLT domain-containing protein [Luteimonas endophytica]
MTAPAVALRAALFALWLLWAPVHARDVAAAPAGAGAAPEAPAGAPARSGREIYARFREGLADPECTAEQSERWRRHFAHVPDDLAASPERLLPLFGYVIDALRDSHLPTEYALIPFVESGYRPGARSASGPAGLWQFIAVTARKHKIAIRPGYDGRLSPVDSTRAAVRYLRTLHGMFAGDWRLAVMGYNAGEYRVFGALRAAGQRAMDADPERLQVPRITQAYVRKLQALSCLLVEAGESEDWLRAIDRPVPVLAAAPLPAGTSGLDAWAQRQGHDARLVRRLNPAFVDGRVTRAGGDPQVLAPARAAAPGPGAAVGAANAAAEAPGASPADGFVADASALVAEPGSGAGPRTHVVARGDSIWRLARRYRVTSAELLERNGLTRDSVLRPGTTLLVDAPAAEADAGNAAAPPVAN